MINLIPPQGHQALNKEYVLRVASVCACMLSVVFFASAALLVPTYVYISTQVRAVEHQNIESSAVSEEFKAAEASVKFANIIITQLAKGKETPVISLLIEEVKRIAPANITFKTIEMSITKDDVNDLRIQGVAPSRATLLALKQAIEESPLFESAVLPISDLARDADLPFSITVILPKPQK